MTSSPPPPLSISTNVKLRSKTASCIELDVQPKNYCDACTYARERQIGLMRKYAPSSKKFCCKRPWTWGTRREIRKQAAYENFMNDLRRNETKDVETKDDDDDVATSPNDGDDDVSPKPTTMRKLRKRRSTPNTTYFNIKEETDYDGYDGYDYDDDTPPKPTITRKSRKRRSTANTIYSNIKEETDDDDDYDDDTPHKPPTTRKSRKRRSTSNTINPTPKEETLPQKLHRMLHDVERDDYTSIVSFFPHGRAFAIHNPRRFVQDIMPHYFPRIERLSVFVRRLTEYGFKYIGSGPDKGGYYHDFFLRERPGLCERIRKITFGELKRDGTSPINFYGGTDGPPSSSVATGGMTMRHSVPSTDQQSTTSPATTTRPPVVPPPPPPAARRHNTVTPPFYNRPPPAYANNPPAGVGRTTPSSRQPVPYYHQPSSYNHPPCPPPLFPPHHDRSPNGDDNDPRRNIPPHHTQSPHMSAPGYPYPHPPYPIPPSFHQPPLPPYPPAAAVVSPPLHRCHAVPARPCPPPPFSNAMVVSPPTSREPKESMNHYRQPPMMGHQHPRIMMANGGNWYKVV